MIDLAKKERRDRDIQAALAIDGWLSQDEAETLYDLAAESKGPIVEIGCWRGRSTAAIALGAASGTKQQVYAVDSFKGIQPGAVPTAHGEVPGWKSSTPELLRENLTKAGVNGNVTIVAKPSEEAVNDVPERCGMLFIDGNHDYEAVCRDIDYYLPKLPMEGVAVFHDVTAIDMGVVKAFDEKVMSDPRKWQVMGRVDSAMVVKRHDTERRSILLACPGKSFCWGMVQGVIQASLGAHDVRIPESSGGTGWDDFNALWAAGLNLAEADEITHFAMLHSDVVPDAGWIDVLMGEMESLGADLISTAIPLKDNRGLTSCGLGDPANRWSAWRRFTVRELAAMPPTFSLGDTGYTDKILLHNTGCWVCDLRNPMFFETDADGSLKCWFDFPTKVSRLPNGKWAHARESEDWFFSRKLHERSAKTFITRKVRLRHRGDHDFPNHGAWGTYKNGDEDTAPLWRSEVTE